MTQLNKRLNVLGPGFVIAATGLGAGDLVAAAVSGATLGATIVWAVILGAAIKLLLNEGLARWQLATGSSVLQAWRAHLPRWANAYFLVYLILWSALVGAALMAACGLAGHALFPRYPVNVWAAIHSLLALLLVLIGRYSWFEGLMKALIALMFVTVISAALLMDLSELDLVASVLRPRLPLDRLPLVLGVIGGVGGSVTLLCYGYWMREKGWNSIAHLRLARIDLTVAYVLTGLFGVCIMLIAAKAQPPSVQGTGIIVALADQLGAELGPAFRWVFLLGFWGAVFSSMLGVWQGVPYLFADYVRAPSTSGDSPTLRKSVAYRGFLIFLAGPPLLLLSVGKPVWLVLLYSAVGALFMPFLALTLLYLNGVKLAGPQRSGIATNLLVILVALLFGWIGVLELMH